MRKDTLNLGEYLRGLVSGKSVYLDIDDLYVWTTMAMGTTCCHHYITIIHRTYSTLMKPLFQADHLLKKEYDNRVYSLQLESVRLHTRKPRIPSAIIAVVAIAGSVIGADFHENAANI